jgi:hypothetical protein
MWYSPPQIPTGWDATRFGIPADMIGRLDPVVLYSLVAVSGEHGIKLLLSSCRSAAISVILQKL